MCGILGFVKTGESKIDDIGVDKILKHLYSFSEIRGHDSSGIAVVRNNKIEVNKRALPASKYLKTDTYKELISNPKGIKAIIAHARMETNGSFAESKNNQPVIKDGLITVHNGIIVNDEELWETTPQIKRKYQVDTEVFNSLVSFYREGSKDLFKSVEKALKDLKGSYSFASLFSQFNYLLLATNTGSLYYIKDEKFLMFASELSFLDTLIKKFPERLKVLEVIQLKPNSFALVDIDSLKLNFENPRDIVEKERKIQLVGTVKEEETSRRRGVLVTKKDKLEIEKHVDEEYRSRLGEIKGLKRCTRCILPETMPFIEFDDEGVCNYCKNYKKIELEGIEKLKKQLFQYKRNDGKPDCIMAFSGGRDSSFALHYIKKEMNMNPIAYSYDWGMITDLGRRNQARMTGELGIEHVLVSADIQRKRENIRMNVNAWLKRPSLGTVPLFMAGDKQYFYYASMLSKQKNLDLVILSENLLEVTNFKTGFCNIKPKVIAGKKFYALSLSSMFRLLFFYGKEYLLNPSYINRSVLDSIGAFGSYYVMPHHLLSLYSYINWDEKEVEDVLLNKYDWEIAEDTNTTWRIGDGTASFYNYIYYTIAGFSEIDTFRSNQIREGVLTREEALLKAEKENSPRIESLIWYTDTIGVNLLPALKRINSVKTLY
jgi:glutamine---fructose-6-phosphate transaminase (isomerizing)